MWEFVDDSANLVNSLFKKCLVFLLIETELLNAKLLDYKAILCYKLVSTKWYDTLSALEREYRD